MSSDTFKVVDNDNDNTREAPTRSKAEEMKATAEDLGSDNVEILPPNDDSADASPVACGICGDPVANPADATADVTGQPVHTECWEDNDVQPTSDAEVVDDADAEEVVDAAPAPDANHEPEALSPDEIERYAENLDERDVGQDPLKWMPGEFVDTIEGTQSINRKGFEVLRFFYGIDLDMTREVDPVDNDMTHARYKCVATTPEGNEVEAWGTSHVDRGDEPYLLIEMAATRARKRALSIATGAGAVAVAELKNEPEGQ